MQWLFLAHYFCMHPSQVVVYGEPPCWLINQLPIVLAARGYQIMQQCAKTDLVCLPGDSDSSLCVWRRINQVSLVCLLMMSPERMDLKHALVAHHKSP